MLSLQWRREMSSANLRYYHATGELHAEVDGQLACSCKPQGVHTPFPPKRVKQAGLCFECLRAVPEMCKILTHCWDEQAELEQLTAALHLSPRLRNWLYSLQADRPFIHARFSRGKLQIAPTKSMWEQPANWLPSDNSLGALRKACCSAKINLFVHGGGSCSG